MKFFAVEDEGSNRRAVRGLMEDNGRVDIGRRAEFSSAVVASPRVITDPQPQICSAGRAAFTQRALRKRNTNVQERLH